MQQKLGSQNQQQPASDGTLKTEIPDLNGPVTPVPAANASFVPPVHSAAAPVVQAQVVQQPAAPAQPVQPQMVQPVTTVNAVQPQVMAQQPVMPQQVIVNPNVTPTTTA